MNSTGMKKFALEARRELLQKIREKVEQNGIVETAIIEEAAYTWFIRFVAHRFMEVNGYLPEIVVDTFYKTEESFKTEIIKQCNHLHDYFPFLFSKNDNLESLFPEGLLNEQSFIRKLTDTKIISEEKWKQVEVIGWLYQYFFAEEKDRIIKAKKKYKTEEIPYATQLFTPDWIVRYMVQNTLGRYWIESHPEHRDLLANWEYYIENPKSQQQDLVDKHAPYINKDMKVEELKCFDPAMGSGHILVYMFDILYEIYSRCGYNKREIPRLIIENNLYGLDIDDRVYQLACFLVVMKAAQYDRECIQNQPIMNICSIQETKCITDDDISYLAGESEGIAFSKIKQFMGQFKNAKTYGSLVHIEMIDLDFIKEKYNQLMKKPAKRESEAQSREKLMKLVPALLKQTEILQLQYDVLITNPPYIGNRYLNVDLVKHVDTYYSIGKKDLFSAFMLYSFKKVKKHGQLGFMTPYVWMFISSYEQLREHIINEKNISSLIQLEYSGFDGATVPVCTFTLRNYTADISGEYISLANFKGIKNQPCKTLEAIKNPNVDYRFSVRTANFKQIPGNPFSFWAGKKTIHAIGNAEKLESIAKPRVGLQTSDNNRFLRLWHEVEYQNIGFEINDRNEAIESKLKWFPYNKGGEFRKWYGNHFYVVNWEEDGREIREYNAYLNASRDSKIGIANTAFYFKESITWSFVSSSHFGVRYSEKGFIFDTGGSSVFVDSELIYYVTAFLCSKLAFEFLRIQNPTLNFQPGNIANLPVVITKDEQVMQQMIGLAKENIFISKKEWNCYETSWDFASHPLLQFTDSEKTIESSFKKWHEFTQQSFKLMKNNEEKLNRLFIKIYSVNDEMTPDVKDENVTYRMANKEREIKSFISYAVGCMFGRYSLDEQGLIFAGGQFDPISYKTFSVVEDNIIPIGLDESFENDIVTRFVEFVGVTFSEETLADNLEYIAATLGKKSGETAKQTIRRYFLNDFFKDHLQVYKKRPIYWLFTSGKQKAFNCLIYMHRLDKTTISRIRKDYLEKLLTCMEAERYSLLRSKESSTLKERTQFKKELKVIENKIEELKQFDKLLYEMAGQEIKIDLDDGVSKNYAKFAGLVAPLK